MADEGKKPRRVIIPPRRDRGKGIPLSDDRPVRDDWVTDTNEPPPRRVPVDDPSKKAAP